MFSSSKKAGGILIGLLSVIALLTAWYLLSYGFPIGKDIKDDNYVCVTVTRLDNGQSVSFTARTDRADIANGAAFMRFERAANVLHLVRVTPLKAPEVTSPQVRFTFEMENGQIRTFVIGDGSASSDGTAYRMHHWSDSELFNSIIYYTYFEDSSIDISTLVVDDD